MASMSLGMAREQASAPAPAARTAVTRRRVPRMLGVRWAGTLCTVLAPFAGLWSIANIAKELDLILQESFES